MPGMPTLSRGARTLAAALYAVGPGAVPARPRRLLAHAVGLGAALALACGPSARGGSAAPPVPERPVARAEELFAGRFPGVNVYQASGGLIVRVRNSSTGGDPLYVIDGFPRAPGTGGLIDINPNDIAKIEVLKDAVSMAEYGSRGGNGIVKITTKRGQAPKR